MKPNFLKALAALGLAAATVLSAAAADAASISRSKYESQFKSGDLFLPYDVWAQMEEAFVNGERNALPESAITPLNLDQVTWKAGSKAVEIFFINEGAAAINSLLMSINGGPASTTVFDPIASKNSIIPEKESDIPAGKSLLGLGQGVNLGKYDIGTVLNFYLKTTRRRGGAPFLLGADPTQNPDKMHHINVFSVGEYLILGFEDRLANDGSDFDYNDVVFAVKGLEVPRSEPVPEPATAAALLGAAAFGLVKTRRKVA